MSAGRRRHLVRVRIPLESDDDRGGQAIDFEDGPDRWAEVRPVSAREQAVAGSVQVLATHVVEMAYDGEITTACRLARIAPEGVELQILGIRDEDGRQRTMFLDCAEAVNP